MPCSVCTKARAKSILWREAGGNRENAEEAMRVERRRNREFWCRGYYVDTVGKDKKKIAEYIRKQLEENRLGEQLTMQEKDNVPIRSSSNNLSRWKGPFTGDW